MDNQSIADQFFSYLLRLKDDSAAMAILRRSLAFPPGTFTPAFPYVVPFLPEKGNELPFFLTAALFAMHPLVSSQSDLGEAFRKLGDSPSIEGRFKALLQCREEELPTHLRGAVSLFAAKNIPVCYVDLFRAIKYWEHPEKFIQKKMARSFWSVVAVS